MICYHDQHGRYRRDNMHGYLHLRNRLQKVQELWEVVNGVWDFLPFLTLQHRDVAFGVVHPDKLEGKT